MSGLEDFQAAKDWVLTALMGAVVYFVKGVHSEMKKIAEGQAHQATVQAVQSERLVHLEKEVAGLRLWRDDISTFFQSLGFRKRDG